MEYSGAGVPCSSNGGGQQLIVSTDTVGSPRVVTRPNGTVVKTVEYSAFGEVLSDSDPSLELPIGFGTGIPDTAAGIRCVAFPNENTVGHDFGSARIVNHLDLDLLSPTG